MKKIIFLMFGLLIISITACENNSDNSDELPDWGSKVISAFEITSYSPEGTPSYNDSAKALGLPKGGGLTSGSLDVVSLGNDGTGRGGSITLRFSSKVINGNGTDFKVFENPFGEEDSVFIECAYVEVSLDGTTWYEFPSSIDSSFSEGNTAHYSGLAGTHPVISNEKKSDSPEPENILSGGDSFDLADLPEPVKSSGFYFIRITDAGAEIHDPGNNMGINDNGFDLDAVCALNYE